MFLQRCLVVGAHGQNGRCVELTAGKRGAVRVLETRPALAHTRSTLTASEIIAACMEVRTLITID